MNNPNSVMIRLSRLVTDVNVLLRDELGEEVEGVSSDTVLEVRHHARELLRTMDKATSELISYLISEVSSDD